MLTQHLRDREDDVGGGDARRDLAGDLEADDPRDEHRDGLAEHGGLGLDATDAPAEDAEAVLHRRVRVGTDARVGVGDAVALHDDPREVLDVDLVHDAGARGDDLEVVERALAPTEELVALTVALVLVLDVALEGVTATEHVDLHGVVDDEFGGTERVDALGVAAEVGRGLTHRREVDDARHAGEVLHEHPRRGELDLGVGLGVLVPVPERADVVGGDVRAVLGAQQVLQQHLEAVRQRGRSLDLVDPVDVVGRVPDLQGVLGLETVGCVAHDVGLLRCCRCCGRSLLISPTSLSIPRVCAHLGVSQARIRADQVAIFAHGA